LAYEYDPYFSLSISRVDPLPHQLEAVYDYFMVLPEFAFSWQMILAQGRQLWRTSYKGIKNSRIGKKNTYCNSCKSLISMAERNEGQIP